MELELTERSQELLELLMTIPPQFDIAKKHLEADQLTADEVTRVANVYADKCFRDYDEYLYDIFQYEEYSFAKHAHFQDKQRYRTGMIS